MGSWEFIALAYGVAAVVLGGYLVGLRSRLKEAQDVFLALSEGRRR